jgi:NADPH2:quinone reductase
LTVIADASPQAAESVSRFGADTIVERGDDFAAKVLAHYRDGVDAVADGALLGGRVVQAVRAGGAIAAVRPFEGIIDRGIALHEIYVRERAYRGTSSTCCAGSLNPEGSQ